MSFPQCEEIPVRVIALSKEKYAVARDRISDASSFSDVQQWKGVRGADLFDKRNRLLPNYREIVREKYPNLSLPPEPSYLLSSQAELAMLTGKTNPYDLATCGAIGCALSHISLWQYIVANEIPAMIVFEDDVVFEKRFTNMKNKDSLFCRELNKILSHFRLNFDVLNFHIIPLPSQFRHGAKLVPTPLSNVIQLKGMATRTQGYLITLQGARELLDNAFPLTHGIDIYMSLMTILPMKQHKIVFLATKTPWLKHPLIDFCSSQVGGYCLQQITSDAMFFIPPTLLLAIIVASILLLISLIFVIVVNCNLRKRLKEKERKRVGNGERKVEKT